MGTQRTIGGRDASPCPVCDATPVVLIALRHPVMRRWTDELLDLEHGCWDVEQLDDQEALVDALVRTSPDLVVMDEADFPSCCSVAVERLPRARVIVVGPEPDTAYRSLAATQGAGGWISRDTVADELSTAMRAALGCRHHPCPPAKRTAPVEHAAFAPLTGGTAP